MAIAATTRSAGQSTMSVGTQVLPRCRVRIDGRRRLDAISAAIADRGSAGKTIEIPHTGKQTARIIAPPQPTANAQPGGYTLATTGLSELSTAGSSLPHRKRCLLTHAGSPIAWSGAGVDSDAPRLRLPSGVALDASGGAGRRLRARRGCPLGQDGIHRARWAAGDARVLDLGRASVGSRPSSPPLTARKRCPVAATLHPLIGAPFDERAPWTGMPPTKPRRYRIRCRFVLGPDGSDPDRVLHRAALIAA